MNSKRFFYVMVGVTSLLGFAIIVAIYFGNNLLVKQSNKLQEHKLESQVADQQQVLLTKAKKDIEKYSDLSSAAKQIVPQDKSQASVVREIANIAAGSGIKLSSITFPNSTLGQKSTTSSTSGEASSTSPSSKNKAPVTQVQPVQGLSGVFAMPITIQSDPTSNISYTSFINFLKKLENNRRTAQVSSITLTPDRRNNNNLSFNIVLNAYIKPTETKK